MHRQLARIYAEGLLRAPDGEDVRFTSHVPRVEAQLLCNLVKRVGTGDVVEVGMSVRILSLALADALEARGGDGALLSSCPAQHDPAWRGLRLAQGDAAGLSHGQDFRERPSHEVRPELWQASRRFTVAFVDGWHTFDHTLLNCFYADRMLDVGGYWVLDDVAYPAIRRVARFLLANWARELGRALYAPGETSHHGIRRAIKRLLSTLARTDQSPCSKHLRLFPRLVGTHAVAPRELATDGRHFDHFVVTTSFPSSLPLRMALAASMAVGSQHDVTASRVSDPRGKGLV